MPHFPQRQKEAPESFQSRENIKPKMQPAMARDHLKNAYAGNENKGPAGSKTSQAHSTNVKGRVTEKSKTKTPAR